jgi:hypothetical protein
LWVRLRVYQDAQFRATGGKDPVMQEKVQFLGFGCPGFIRVVTPQRKTAFLPYAEWPMSSSFRYKYLQQTRTQIVCWHAAHGGPRTYAELL